MKKERQKVLQEVYRYLFGTGNIKSIQDFADQIGRQRPGLSAAMNGNELYLTNSLFQQINKTFPNTFNLDYLLNGEGELLHHKPSSMVAEEPADYSTQPLPLWADALISIMSKQIKENEALNSELRQTLSEVRTLRDDLQTLISTLKSPE